MRALALLLLLGSAGAAPAAPPKNPALEGLLAADAAVWAPPDFKRQLVKHRSRLMQGVADAARDDAGGDAAARRREAAALARSIAQRIRGHVPFSDVAADAGALVHACAAVGGLPEKAPAASRFLGFPPDPFRDPESLLAIPDGTGRWDAALTRATRLLAWAWKAAGGDASLATRTPEAKGPYPVRE